MKRLAARFGEFDNIDVLGGADPSKDGSAATERRRWLCTAGW